MTAMTAERATDTVSPAALQQAREAMQALTLCHSQAPESESAEHSHTVWVGEDTQGTFDILSPRQTGKSVQYLEEFFNKDQKRAWSVEFEHPMITEDAQHLSMHCHTMPMRAVDFIESGIRSDDKSAQYCLFARNEQGRITSFIRFSISLQPLESIFGEYDPENEDTDISDAWTCYLNIELDAIYTRARFRGRGAGVALLSAMQQVVQDEFQNLSEQLAPVSKATGIVFQLHPYVYNKLSSRAGMLVHNKLMDGLDMEQEFQEHLCAEEPVRRALKVLEADDSGTEY